MAVIKCEVCNKYRAETNYDNDDEICNDCWWKLQEEKDAGERCKNCEYRKGIVCGKHGEEITDNDWCSSYKNSLKY
ncbi:MAG TPA: hypothetical protein ENH82_09630 [bacterium]|nr:hypothetical protein [bacterium]